MDISSRLLSFSDIEDSLFNRQSFKFSHDLCQLPELRIDRLKELVLRLPSAQRYVSSSNVDLRANLDTAHKEHGINVSLEHALANLEESESFFMIRSPETDPALKDVFTCLKTNVDQYVAKQNGRIVDSTLYMFLTSPGGITPYHIDRYSTFLFQLQGSKQVSTWAPWDKKMVAPELMEQFFARTHTQAPAFDESFLSDARTDTINPGDALHIPFVAPHSVENGSEVSVSLSIIFNTDATEILHNALLFNENLRRRFHLKPTPVNESMRVDQMKSLAYRVSRKVNRILR